MPIIPRHPPRTWDSKNSSTVKQPRTDEERGVSPPPPPLYSEIHEEKASLDITQKLEKKLAEFNGSENIFRRWLCEIVTWALSALCMVGIVTILLHADKKTLAGRNTEIMVFTALSKIASAALLLPTSEALGQLKWNWFNGKKSKEIWDFEIFDKASRGAWGSVLLLFRTKGRSLAALGAILTLLLIANDSFYQQVVNMREDWSEGGIGSAAAVIKYNPEYRQEFRGGIKQAQQDPNLYSTLLKYFYANGTQPVPFGNGTQPEIPVSCPTSNCTFPEYETLGVCSECKQITEMLEYACKISRFDWSSRSPVYHDETKYPNTTMCGYFLNASSEFPVFMSGYSTTAPSRSDNESQAEALLLRTLPLVKLVPDHQTLWGGSIHFKNVRNPLVDVIIVASDNAGNVFQNKVPVAHECVLSWCTKKIRSSYSFATYNEEILSTFINSTAGPDPWTSLPLPNSSTDVYYNEDIVITSESSEKTYGMSNATHFHVWSTFLDIFPAFLTTANASEEPSLKYKTWSVLDSKPFTRKLKFNPWLSSNNVTRHFERMASSMTNLVRSSDSRESIVGSAYNKETFVHVQWAWLTFPFALLVLTLIFLVGTMRKTSKGADETGPGVWKTSAMPSLMYSLPKDLQTKIQTKSHDGENSEPAGKNIKLRLHPKKGWRVSGHPLSPVSPVIVFRSNQPPPGWI